VTELETWMLESRGKLSRHNPVAKAMDYMLTRWEAFTRFLSDGRICQTNNAAERATCRLARTEDGRLWICDTDVRATLGLTERGIECLKELSLNQKR
jgi:hypothetical protein